MTILGSINPVVNVALRLIGNHSDRFIEGILVTPCLKEILKNVLTSTAHKLRRVVSM